MGRCFAVRCSLVGNVYVEAESEEQAVERVKKFNELDVVDAMYEDVGEVEVLSASLIEDQ